jgi:hypothetical protein
MCPPGASAVVDSGQWTIDSLNGNYRLVFANFNVRSRNETFPGAEQSPGTWVVPVVKTITGELQLEVDGDIGWHYTKKPSRP